MPLTLRLEGTRPMPLTLRLGEGGGGGGGRGLAMQPISTRRIEALATSH